MAEQRANNNQNRITFLEGEVRKWRDLAQRDQMTGMYNKVYFEKLVADAVEMSKTDELYSGLIMFDIDHFKSINDTYGHQIGDEVIKQISDITTHHIVRENDILARVGGEEFALFLISGSEISDERLIKIAESIRSQVSEIVFTADGKDFKVTVSLGVGKYNGSENDKKYIDRIDKALYKAKQGGRDRVEVA